MKARISEGSCIRHHKNVIIIIVHVTRHCSTDTFSILQWLQIQTTVTEEEQAELLVNIEAQGFAGLVHYTKLVSYNNTAVGGVCRMQVLVVTSGTVWSRIADWS